MAHDDEHSMQCMEVWGGNQAANSSVKLAGLDAWVYSKPYEQADGGGDVYYVSSCATGRITRLLVADVSGHGNAVAQVAIVLRQLMRQHVNQIDQVKFVQRMNEQFVTQSRLGQFATAVVTTYFAPTCALSLCNAGHPPPLLYRAKSKSWQFIENEEAPGDNIADVPLGIIDLADYEQFKVELERDDLVLCYTDSLPEARRADGSMIGMAALLEIVKTIDIGEPSTLIPRIVSAIESHCAREITGDDITMLLFKPNHATARVSIATQLFAPIRIVSAIAQSIFSGDRRIPLPEFSVANLLAWMLPARKS